MFKRIRNLWRISSIELPKPTTPSLQQKLKEAITGKRPATIVETEDLPDMFPDHDETA